MTPTPHIQFPVVALLLVTLTAAAPAAQQPPPRAPGTASEGVTAVLVDVVVRDRRGQPVRDLSPSDVEILEDGVPQALDSFTPVFDAAPPVRDTREGEQATNAAKAPVAAAGVDSHVLVTALVFDRLTPEARRLAVEAAGSYLGTAEQVPHHVGVYAIDLSLRPYAPFTRNGPMLRKAIEAVGRGLSAAFNAPEQQQQRASADDRAASASAAAQNAGGAAGAAAGVDAKLAQMQGDMLRDFEAMERSQQGYATTHALFAIVGRLAELPGRKSIVFFAEGLALPDDVQRRFLALVDAANRANVSIYTIDAAGLRAESEQAKVRDRVNRAARAGIDTAYSGDTSGGALTRTLELNEEALRQDPGGALGRLAQFTGGLLFNNTNNLRHAVARIDDDLRNYYLLGYTPANQSADGRFRAIDVRVKRAGVTVAARKGYFAVPDAGTGAVSPWESAALVALSQKPVPNAFPVRAGALRFPERGRPGLTPVIVDFGTDALTFRPADDGASYTSNFGVLVRFLDHRNQVVRRVGQHYEVKGQIADMDGARRGEVVFYREPELGPGTYTMEAIVYDALGEKASVRFSTVEVPPAADGALRMSSLVLVKGAEQVPEADRRADNPLLINDVVLRPNLGGTVSKSAQEAVFYFTVYPAAQGGTPAAAIQVLHNGKTIGQVPMLVGEADAAGRVQQLGRLPLAELAPGTYELQATVKQGNAQVSASTILRVVE